MKKGIIVNLKKFKLLDYVNINKIFLVLCILFISGITIGATLLSKNDFISEKIKEFFESYILLNNTGSFFQKIFSSFIKYLLIVLLYFISGSSMLGVAITPFVTVWQGIFLGSTISYLYKTEGLSGIAFNAIIIVPPMVVFTICCFYAAKYSIEFSLLIAKLTLPRSRPTNLYAYFKNYCGKYLLLIALSLLCSIFEFILNLLFLKFFSF